MQYRNTSYAEGKFDTYWFEKNLILWMNVLDGDITPCVGISYVSLANRRHFNLKNSDLSKIRQ